jgi:hypothetical protein
VTKGILLFFSFLLPGCSSGPAEPPPPPQSKPVHVELNSSQPPPLPELAEPEALQSAVGALTGLEGMDLYLAVGVMNLVPAPCEPCFPGTSLGVCLLSPQPGCENLPALAERAARLVRAGTDQHVLRDQLSYAEPWIPDATAEDNPDAVDIELWLDPGTPGTAQLFERIAAVEASAGTFALHIRPMGDGPEDIAGRGLAAAAAQGAAKTYLQSISSEATEAEVRALAASQGLDVARFAADFEAARVDVAVMRTKGVRSSPTWFVEGYRLRGLQSVDAIGRLVKMASSDLLTPETPNP